MRTRIACLLAAGLLGCGAEPGVMGPLELCEGQPCLADVLQAPDRLAGSERQIAVEEPLPGPHLRVMTYNIRFGGELGWQLDDIASVIRAQQVDIVGLQEVDHLQVRSGMHREAEELAEATGLVHQYYGCALHCGDTLPGRYGLAILSRHELVEREKVFLPNTPDGDWMMEGGPEPRVLLCGRVAVEQLPVRFCVTHLSNGADQGAAATRQHQAEYILEQLADELPEGRVVLVGDLNESPSWAAVSRLRGVLEDSLDEVGDPGLTIPADTPSVRFDYILHGAGSATLAASVPSTTASDHRPVVAELELAR
ncbi:MAG: endonuclease/exonuclease/phosphatase family protein [Deltaproteobacteria bacterium]|nr:endonuclease/exonuclease/phosphatase family protein [Deltaproteobacteria bacterium]